MTDIASVVPDTATVPVAEDLVHPQPQQNGRIPSHLQVSPVDDSATSTRSATPNPPHSTLLNGKLRSDSDEKEFESAQHSAEPLSVEQGGDSSKPKTGVLGAAAAILDDPLKGPRGGIHWGAGMSLSQQISRSV